MNFTFELGFSIFTIIFMIIGFILGLVIYGTIAKKAGYSFWWGLIMFVPLANFIALICFVVAKWPVQKKLEACEVKLESFEENL